MKKLNYLNDDIAHPHDLIVNVEGVKAGGGKRLGVSLALYSFHRST